MTNKYHLTPIEVLSKFNEYSLPKNFCIVPFTNIILNPEGDISICRQKGTKHIVGSLKNNTIEEIWNNDYLKKWRSEFLNGDINICKNEIQSDACHIGSGSYFYIDKAQIDIVQDNLPIKLTANFNGKCNLKCKMCDVWTLSNGFYDRINYWEELNTKFFPYIQEVEMLSGEPFIQNDTWKLISQISKINPMCIWSFTTNAHYELTNEMKSELDKIEIKNIIVSIETLNEKKYEKIRIGGRLDRVKKTISQFNQYNESRSPESKISLNIHFLVLKDNLDEIDDVIKFCDENKFMLILNCLVEPSEMSLKSLSSMDVESRIKELLSSEIYFIKRKMRIIMFLINLLPKIDQASYLSEIKELIKE